MTHTIDANHTVKVLVASLDPDTEYAITPDLVAHPIRRVSEPFVAFYDLESGKEIRLAFGPDFIRLNTFEVRRLKHAAQAGYTYHRGTLATAESLVNRSSEIAVNGCDHV